MESFRAEVLLGRMVRLRNRAENLMCEVLELCCSEWFQNLTKQEKVQISCFRAVLF